ncbi:MAG: hypothetical protein KDB14_05370 [Planctomycetales bacterium]|nr:hypothetical protein [Planctomycetales bacterium]
MLASALCAVFAAHVACRAVAEEAATEFVSHPPTRPLPQPFAAPVAPVMAPGKLWHVDPTRGDDAGDGGEQQPWRTLAYATRQLQPGDTLLLRGGVYYERLALTRSGEQQRPITIRAYPGELPVVDGGLREFRERPEQAWMPLDGGAEGEYVSTATYPGVDARRAPTQFLPASWEPMWGIEDERPLALGHFGDSMVPLHGYRLLADLRAKNELWTGNKQQMSELGLYGGPGLWFNRETQRVHIRLAHHQMAGLEGNAYRGETDPRRLQLSIALGFGEEVMRIVGLHDVALQGIVFRGATGSPLLHVYGSQRVTLDHLTLFGGFPGLLVNASQQIRVTHSAFRGLAAPWTSRAHMKYRGTASYQIVFRNEQPINEDIELANCEFTDDHDFAFLRYVKNLQFHHNLVDNFNDDGLECGAKLRDHTLYIYQNRIGRCLIPITQHEIMKDEAPLDHDEGSGVHIYRNVFDMRGGVYKSPPAEPDATGAYLRGEGHLAGDHGSPIWPVMRVYHNTFVRETPVFRNYFLFGLGAQGLRQNERDVFNNLFVQTDRVPGVVILGKDPGKLREGGNLIWGVTEGRELPDEPAKASALWFAKFRRSPLFALSQQVHEPGWTTQDRVADPRFVKLSSAVGEADDLRLRDDSPAIDFGRPLPESWPDPLRSQDDEHPDSGALPRGVEPARIGVDGRLSLFSNRP